MYFNTNNISVFKIENCTGKTLVLKIIFKMVKHYVRQIIFFYEKGVFKR